MDRGNNILAFTFIFCIDFIAIFVLISLQLCQLGCCYFNMYKSNQLTGNVYNDSEVTINE